jgi:hypothetical protein
MPAPDIVTTVLTPATSYDLVDLATVKDELSIPPTACDKDAFLQRAISQVSFDIAQYCDRVFPLETVQDIIYPHRHHTYPRPAPGGIAPLQLARWPIVVVAWATLFFPPNDITMVDGVDFFTKPDQGQLVRLDGAGNPRSWDAVPISVIYDAGYSPIPADIAGIALRLVTMRTYNRGRDPSIMQQDQPGLGSVRYWAGSMPGMSGPFPQEIAASLDGYRQPVFA